MRLSKTHDTPSPVSSRWAVSTPRAWAKGAICGCLSRWWRIGAALCALSLSAATINLEWNPQSDAASFNVYQSVGTNSFSFFSNVLTNKATVTGVSTNIMSRYYVSALNPKGESQPSNIVTNFPTATPPTGAIVLSTPALTITNLTPGQTVKGTATISNNRNVPLVVTEGWLTAREPSASNQGGPFDDWAPGLSPQTISPGQTVAITAAWVVRTNAPAGVWRAHLAVKDDAGLWRDGPDATFTVTATPPPLQPPRQPTGLRVVQVQGRRFDIGWSSDTTARTQVERSIESAPFAMIASVNPGTMHLSTQIDRRQTYAFRVRSLNSGGFSPYSDTVTLTGK